MINEMKMSEMHPIITSSIKENGCFIFYPRGTSMLPTIYPEKDGVELIAADNIELYDVILYRRNNGQYVMHRVVGIKNGKLTLCGDNQTAYEKGITADMVIAKASRIIKPDGTQLECIGKSNALYAKKLRRRLTPLRITRFCKRLVYRIYKYIFKKGDDKNAESFLKRF